MQIVTQSALLSYSLFPTRLQLPAPPPRLALPAPRIAGLLPATVTPHADVIIEKPLTLRELVQQLGPVRSQEAMNLEIAEMALEALDFLHSVRAAQRRYS